MAETNTYISSRVCTSRMHSYIYISIYFINAIFDNTTTCFRSTLGVLSGEGGTEEKFEILFFLITM